MNSISRTMTLGLLLVLGLASGASAQQQENSSLLGGRVTFVLQPHWILNHHSEGKTTGRIEQTIPYHAGELAGLKSLATVSTKVLREWTTVEHSGKETGGGVVVVSDVSDGQNWRTLVSTAEGEQPYLFLERFGVVNGVSVELRVAFPLLKDAEPGWAEKTIRHFNEVCASLKIDGRNRFESRVRVEDLSEHLKVKR